MNPRDIAMVVRHERRKRGWTQRHLAGLLGVNIATISRIETGHLMFPRREYLRDLSEAFGLDLMGYEPRVRRAPITQRVYDLEDRMTVIEAQIRLLQSRDRGK